jgi:hypothetical protein
MSATELTAPASAVALAAVLDEVGVLALLVDVDAAGVADDELATCKPVALVWPLLDVVAVEAAEPEPQPASNTSTSARPANDAARRGRALQCRYVDMACPTF